MLKKTGNKQKKMVIRLEMRFLLTWHVYFLDYQGSPKIIPEPPFLTTGLVIITYTT